MFNTAVDLPTADRVAFLQAECGQDAALLRRVEKLLEANERAGAGDGTHWSEVLIAPRAAAPVRAAWSRLANSSRTLPLLQSLSFNSEPSICYPAKPCPGVDPDTSGLPVPCIAHNFSNSTTNELSVTAQLHFARANPLFYALGAVAYLGTNSPSDPCVNYLGDTGFDGTQPFSFSVPPGSNFVILISARFTKRALRHLLARSAGRSLPAADALDCQGRRTKQSPPGMEQRLF